MDEVLLARLRGARTDAQDALSGAGAALRNAQLAVDGLDDIIAELEAAPADPPAPVPAQEPPSVVEPAPEPAPVEHGPGRLQVATTTFGAPLASVPKGWLSANLDDQRPEKAASIVANLCVQASDAGAANLVVTVPLAWSSRSAKRDPSGSLAAMQAVADGQQDALYWAIGVALVAGGYPHAVLRLGHEHNGTWYAWSSAGDRAPTFVAAWRQATTILRSAAPDVVLDWNVAHGGASPDGSEADTSFRPEAWPGNEFVTLCGYDVYCRSKGRDLDSVSVGLAQHAEFAAAHDTPVSYPEIGVTLPLDGVDSNVCATDSRAAQFLDLVLGFADTADLAYLTMWAANRTDQGYRYRPVSTDRATWAALGRWFPKG